MAAWLENTQIFTQVDVDGRKQSYLTIFWRSAPEKPGVPRARILGSTSIQVGFRIPKSGRSIATF